MTRLKRAIHIAFYPIMFAGPILALYVNGLLAVYESDPQYIYHSGVTLGTEYHHVGFEWSGPEGPGFFTEWR